LRRLFHAPERRAPVFFHRGEMSSTFHMANAEFLHLRAANVPSELWTIDDCTPRLTKHVQPQQFLLCACVQLCKTRMICQFAIHPGNLGAFFKAHVRIGQHATAQQLECTIAIIEQEAHVRFE